MLETLILPRFLHIHAIAKNYQSPQVIAFLKTLLSDDHISKAMKKIAADMLNGKFAADDD